VALKESAEDILFSRIEEAVVKEQISICREKRIRTGIGSTSGRRAFSFLAAVLLVLVLDVVQVHFKV
jgi:hypothetical protein